MKTNNVLLLAVASILLASCATTRQFNAMPVEKTPDQKNTIVYVLRPKIAASAISMAVFCNKMLIGEIGPRGYVCFEVNPGENTIGSKGENFYFLKSNLQQGKTYYIKHEIRWGVWSARCRLKEIDEEKGKKMLAKLKAPVIALN